MTFNFDKIFYMLSKPTPKDYPCRECNELKCGIDNPYYHSAKCNKCKVYKDWRDNNV